MPLRDAFSPFLPGHRSSARPDERQCTEVGDSDEGLAPRSQLTLQQPVQGVGLTVGSEGVKDYASSAMQALLDCLKHDIHLAALKVSTTFAGLEEGTLDEQAARLAHLAVYDYNELIEASLQVRHWVKLLVAQECLLRPSNFGRVMRSAIKPATALDVAELFARANKVTEAIVLHERPTDELIVELSKSYLAWPKRGALASGLDTRDHLDPRGPTYLYWKSDYLYLIARQLRTLKGQELSPYYKSFLEKEAEYGNPDPAGKEVLADLGRQLGRHG